MRLILKLIEWIKRKIDESDEEFLRSQDAIEKNKKNLKILGFLS